MDSGLSTRMRTALDELLPRIEAQAPHKLYDPSTAYDLSCAQNEVLREELMEFFKTAVEDKLVDKASPITCLHCPRARLIVADLRPTKHRRRRYRAPQRFGLFLQLTIQAHSSHFPGTHHTHWWSE